MMFESPYNVGTNIIVIGMINNTSITTITIYKYLKFDSRFSSLSQKKQQQS
jgi:hypothetical protein